MDLKFYYCSIYPNNFKFENKTLTCLSFYNVSYHLLHIFNYTIVI